MFQSRQELDIRLLGVIGAFSSRWVSSLYWVQQGPRFSGGMFTEGTFPRRRCPLGCRSRLRRFAMATGMVSYCAPGSCQFGAVVNTVSRCLSDDANVGSADMFNLPSHPMIPWIAVSRAFFAGVIVRSLQNL
jgi:hypothetical protein